MGEVPPTEVVGRPREALCNATVCIEYDFKMRKGEFYFYCGVKAVSSFFLFETSFFETKKWCPELLKQ